MRKPRPPQNRNSNPEYNVGGNKDCRMMTRLTAWSSRCVHASLSNTKQEQLTMVNIYLTFVGRSQQKPSKPHTKSLHASVFRSSRRQYFFHASASVHIQCPSVQAEAIPTLEYQSETICQVQNARAQSFGIPGDRETHASDLSAGASRSYPSLEGFPRAAPV